MTAGEKPSDFQPAVAVHTNLSENAGVKTKIPTTASSNASTYQPKKVDFYYSQTKFASPSDGDPLKVLKSGIDW
jgi:hypothetical protein